MENRYMILVDENGQPYIAHAFSFKNTFRKVGTAVRNTASNVGRRAKDTHKYIQKIAKNGKTRYFYSQEEWEAYLRGDVAKPKTVVGKAKDKLGYDERERRDQAKREYESEKRVAKRMEDRGREKLMSIDTSSSNQNVHKEAEDALALKQKGADLKEEAQNKYDETAKEYNRTLLGAIDKITGSLKDDKAVEARKAYEEAFESYMRNPTSKNERECRSAYNRWAGTADFDENRKVVSSPDEAVEKAEKETKKLLDIAKREAIDVEESRVSDGANGYDHLNSYTAGDREKLAKEYYEQLSFLEDDLNNHWYSGLKDVRKEIEEFRQKIKELQNENEKEFEEWKKKPKQIFDKNKFDEVLKKSKNIGYKLLAAELKTRKTSYNPVEMFDKIPDEESIIANLGGGDQTYGSCSSLAFAYIGNKAGYKVLDFRGGSSLGAFSNRFFIKQIASLDGVESKSIRVTSDNKLSQVALSMELLESAKEGKEYYFETGQHAAIVRKKDGQYQYLELQSEYANGWKQLDEDTLSWRFACFESQLVSLMAPPLMIDIESLGKSEEFISLLGYINTDKSDQKKGDGGHEK